MKTPLADRLAEARRAQLRPNTLANLPADEYAYAWTATAFHEAGHAVIAALHGPQIQHVAVTPNDPDNWGRCDYIGTLTASSQAAISLAGPAAEARFLYGGSPTVHEIRSVLDGQCAEDGSGDLDHLIASGGPLPMDTVNLINRCWESLKTIVLHMNQHGSADHAVVCAALGIPTVNGHQSAQAASIRAGIPPTPRKLPTGRNP
ncbi:M50 family metallopeptidase [Rhodococcus sp. SJ-2]